MSAVILEVAVRLADAPRVEGDVGDQAVNRLADEVEAAIMGIGEVVGYDYDGASDFVLFVGGDDADRLVAIVMPLVKALVPLPGSYYTVGAADPEDLAGPPTRIRF
jgi:hypothetical protein